MGGGGEGKGEGGGEGKGRGGNLTTTKGEEVWRCSPPNSFPLFSSFFKKNNLSLSLSRTTRISLLHSTSLSSHHRQQDSRSLSLGVFIIRNIAVKSTTDDLITFTRVGDGGVVHGVEHVSSFAALEGGGELGETK